MRRLILTVVGWTVVIVWAIPLIGIVFASLQSTAVVSSEGWWALRDVSLDNYVEVLSRGFANSMVNGFIIVAGAIAIPIAASALLAYGVARFTFRLRSALFTLLVLLQTIPQISVVIPLLIAKRVVPSDPVLSFLWIILVHSAYGTPWITIYLYNFLRAMPRDYEEAAYIDGLGVWGTLTRVVLPIMRPAIFSIAMIQFIWVWHDLLYAVVFLPPELWPPTAAVTKFVSRYNPNWGHLTAASTLAIVVPIVLYAVAHRQYMKAVAGGLKA